MPTVATEVGLHRGVPAALPAQAPAREDTAALPVVRVRVWDLPTRLFHWLLAAGVGGLVLSGRAGGAWIDWHARLGSLVLALLLFRLVWGVFGGRWSRFASFLPTPSRLRRYLAGGAKPDDEAGHSPLGGLSVLAMLGLLLAQVATGMVSDDGGGFTGPLNAQVSAAVAEAATRLHKDYGQWLLLGLVLLHVAAILFYRVVRKRRLLQAMLDGDKRLAPDRLVAASRDDTGSRTAAGVVFAVSLAAVLLVVGL